MNRDDYATSLKKLFFYYPQYPIEMPYRGLEAVKFQYTPWSDMDDEDKNIYALDMAVSDSQFVCPLNFFARAYSSAGQDVYAYYFTQRATNHYWPEWTGVMHGDEILFMFSDVTKWKNNYTFEEQELSKKMILYWSNFAKTGNPNTSPGLVSLDEWPLHSISHQEYLELNTKYLDSSNKWRAVGKGPRMRECAFWNTYLPNLLSEGLNQENKKMIPCMPIPDEPISSGSVFITRHLLHHPLTVCSVVVVRQLLEVLDSRW